MARRAKRKNPNLSAVELFALLRSRAARKVPALRSVRFRTCKQADEEHRKSVRQYAHYGHFPRTVCYARAIEVLPIGWKVGILAHELGHAMADVGGGISHTEEDANHFGSVLVDTPVAFRGEHALEYADPPGWLMRTR